MKNTFKVLTAVFLLAVVFGACNSSGEQQKQKKQDKLATEISTSTANKQTFSLDFQIGDKLPNDLVCMVNDAYMAKPQIPVPVNGKTYYGCCEMCVGTLNNEESARMATDPQTGERVDKTEAFIVLLDANGRGGYFNSEANYTAYTKKS